MISSTQGGYMFSMLLVNQLNQASSFWVKLNNVSKHRLKISSYPGPIQGVYTCPKAPHPTHYTSRLSYNIYNFVASCENLKSQRVRVREHPIFPPCHRFEDPVWECRSVWSPAPNPAASQGTQCFAPKVAGPPPDRQPRYFGPTARSNTKTICPYFQGRPSLVAPKDSGCVEKPCR